MGVETNRDLYTAIVAELRRQPSNQRSLLEYLSAFRGELLGRRAADGLRPAEFVAVIAAAFTVAPEPADTDAWREEDLRVDQSAEATFDSVDRILRSQILDLQDARASGVDQDEHRHFGLAVARRGSGQRATGPHWCNWEPAGYVECGVVGTFGGWEPGDSGGRELVPGLVAAVGSDGEITEVPAEDIPSPLQVVDELTWSDVADVLWAGQTYE